MTVRYPTLLAQFALTIVAAVCIVVAPAAASAAPASLFAVDVTHPASGAWLDGHLWLSDRLYRFCRYDVSTAATDLYNMDKPAGTALPNQSSSSTCPFGNTSIALQPGQPAYDAASNFIYVPDESAKGVGVARYAYNPATQSVFTSGFMFDEQRPAIVAPTAGLTGLRPSSVAVGPDGGLYVGSLNTGDIRRITNPGGPVSAQVASTIGKTFKGGRVYSMAFVGADLYLAEKNGVTVIRNATSLACTGGCQATPVSGIAAVETLALVSDGADTLAYIQGNSVLRYSVAARNATVLATTGTLGADQVPTAFARWYTSDCNGTDCPFAFNPGKPASLTLDGSGNLYVGDDADTFDANLFGRVWRVSLAG